MRSFFLNILRGFISRSAYLLIGLSFSTVIIAVNAAITATTADSGEPLTTSKWNAVINDLSNIRNEVDSVNTNLVSLQDKNSTSFDIDTASCYTMTVAGDGWAMHSCNNGFVLVGMQISMSDKWSGRCCRIVSK